MSNATLKNILVEYEKKKAQKELIARKQKEKLYEQYPELQKIDDDLSSLAITSAKSYVLHANDISIVENMEKRIEELKNKKATFFQKIGVDPNSILPQYDCPFCHDTGYITNEDYTTSMCSCLKQKLFDIEYNKSNIYNLEQQNFDDFSELLYSDQIDKEKYHSNISPRENILRIKQICENFIQHFDEPEEKNLLFTGNTGLGKTFLSSCIANELIKKRKNVLYQTAPVMFDTIINYRFNKSSYNIYDDLLNVDLLIIDDLGTEYMNNMKFAELFNIINTRLLNQHKITKTIISTNLSLKNIYDNYDERIVSRIVGNYNICYFFGDDIRFKNR